MGPQFSLDPCCTLDCGVPRFSYPEFKLSWINVSKENMSRKAQKGHNAQVWHKNGVAWHPLWSLQCSHVPQPTCNWRIWLGAVQLLHSPMTAFKPAERERESTEASLAPPTFYHHHQLNHHHCIRHLGGVILFAHAPFSKEPPQCKTISRSRSPPCWRHFLSPAPTQSPEHNRHQNAIFLLCHQPSSQCTLHIVDPPKFSASSLKYHHQVFLGLWDELCSPPVITILRQEYGQL